MLEALRLLLKGEQYEIETAKSPAGILAALEARDFDAVLMDLNYARDTTSGQEGLDLLHKTQALDWTLPTVVMTAWASTSSAVEAMRRGAYDYVEKPWDNARLLAILRNAIDMGRALRKSQRLESENQTLRRNGMPQLIAESAKMRPVLQLMERIGPSDANVLITGEHGTGKELVAHWLHAASPRASKSFVAVNMGGLSEGVFESELFGHVKGAFTDAKTDRIGRYELADRRHAVPRRDREHHAVAAIEAAARAADRRRRARRVVEGAARRRPRALGDERRSAYGSRRRPLPRRSAVPPQHDRDPSAAAARAARGHSRARAALPQAALWPISQDACTASTPAACSRCSSIRGRATSASSITPSSARSCSRRASSCAPATSGFARRCRAAAPRIEDLTLEEVEKLVIQKALSRFDGNVSQAAKALGLSRSALYRRLETHEI